MEGRARELHLGLAVRVGPLHIDPADQPGLQLAAAVAATQPLHDAAPGRDLGDEESRRDVHAGLHHLGRADDAAARRHRRQQRVGEPPAVGRSEARVQEQHLWFASRRPPAEAPRGVGGRPDGVVDGEGQAAGRVLGAHGRGDVGVAPLKFLARPEPHAELAREIVRPEHEDLADSGPVHGGEGPSIDGR
jgi:hypothetical protein